MKGSRFNSIMRSVLGQVADGLCWVGLSFGLCPAVAAEALAYRRQCRAGRRSPREPEDADLARPLSRKERGEWAAIVELLR